jgi:hypothetical protein
MDETATDKLSPLPVEADVPGHVRVVKARLEASRRHFSDHRYNAAIEEVMAVLDAYPHNREALDLASSILYLCSSDQSQEQIRPSVWNDPLLDNLFSQCHRCHRCWPTNPMYKDFAGQLTIMNPIGGRCPKCRKVWCRDCSRSGMYLVCPDCRMNTEVLKEPSGRRRGLSPSKHPGLKLRKACIFKAPPEPRNKTSYMSMVLDALCPEAFHDKPAIQYRTENQGLDERAALAFAYASARVNGIHVDLEHSFQETFTDTDGGKGLLITFYDAGQQK